MSLHTFVARAIALTLAFVPLAHCSSPSPAPCDACDVAGDETSTSDAHDAGLDARDAAPEVYHCPDIDAALDAPSAATACNGHDELCTRTYDQVAFPGTHNADANRAQHFVFACQDYPITCQLEAGVRVLHLEINNYLDAPYLCHALCFDGNIPLADGFAEIDRFVESHPREVVTLLMESNNVTTDAIASALQSTGLASHLHAQTEGTPWPTLGDMIDHGDHVVAFLADMTMTGGGSYPYLHDRWHWTWETPWDNETPTDFLRCGVDRGTPGVGHLYVVDTYVEGVAIPTPEQAALVNVNPFLIDRLLNCRAVSSQLPNFVMVNYEDIGDLFLDVDILNGFTSYTDANLDAFPPPWPDADDSGMDAALE